MIDHRSYTCSSSSCEIEAWTKLKLANHDVMVNDLLTFNCFSLGSVILHFKYFSGMPKHSKIDFKSIENFMGAKAVKPWPNGPASCRKWTQVKLA